TTIANNNFFLPVTLDQNKRRNMENFLFLAPLFNFNCDLIGQLGAQLAGNFFPNQSRSNKSLAAISYLIFRIEKIRFRQVRLDEQSQAIKILPLKGGHRQNFSVGKARRKLSQI